MLLIVSLAILACCSAAPSPSLLAQHNDLEEIPGLYQGDILIAPNNIRNGRIGDALRWPNATLIYFLDQDFSEEDIERLNAAMKEIENTTCIRFQQRDGEFDYVFVRKGTENSGCYSSVGKVGSAQILNLAPRCMPRHGTLVHEFLHAIGFYHEQSRSNRDDFVTIVWDKIEAGKEHNFNKYDEGVVDDYGAPYDYGSILHYSGFGFSIDGSATIVPKIPGVEIGQRERISQLDAGKVRLMYKCDEMSR